MTTAVRSPTARGGARVNVGADVVVPVSLLALAGIGWWWTTRMGGSSMMAGLSALAFLVAWLAMMAAMMLPAVSPVVRIYALAAAQGRLAPLPYFVSAYLIVWGVLGIPAYFAWSALSGQVMMGSPLAGRLAGGALLVAATWQLTPLKAVCLRHCRSPLSVFLRYGSGAESWLGALRMGTIHAMYCVGCCWALMAVLVAVGTMNVVWMVGLAGLIFAEKVLPFGQRLIHPAAAIMAGLGLTLLLQPHLISNLT